MPSRRYFANPWISSDVSDKEFQPNYWKPKILENVELIRSKVPPLPQYADGGLYVGTPGIAYMFFHISTSPLLENAKADLLSKGIEYCITADTYFDKKPLTCPTDAYGLLLGRGGVNAVSAVLYHLAGKSHSSQEHLKKYASSVQYCAPKYSKSFGCNELFVGRAGFLTGLLWIQSVTGKSILPDTKIHEICQCIVEEGRKNARSSHQPSLLIYPYYNTPYLGAAHGISSILQTLLSFDQFLVAHPDAERDIKHSIDHILSTQTRSGNFPSAVGEKDDELVHWCHGAPGVIYLMAKAYLRWKEPKYLESCVKSAEVIWERGLLTKGPGICHGVAGNGYAFLLMYRLTNDVKYLKRAIAFAEFLLNPTFRRNARTPDNPYSLYEGLAGTMCYVADLAKPQNATFPFMDVFYNYHY